jgi:hypothetical protein
MQPTRCSMGYPACQPAWDRFEQERAANVTLPLLMLFAVGLVPAIVTQ